MTGTVNVQIVVQSTLPPEINTARHLLYVRDALLEQLVIAEREIDDHCAKHFPDLISSRPALRAKVGA